MISIRIRIFTYLCMYNKHFKYIPEFECDVWMTNMYDFILIQRLLFTYSIHIHRLSPLSN